MIVEVACTISRPFSSFSSPSRKPTLPPQRMTLPSANTMPGPIASKKLILSSSVGTATASLPLAIAAFAMAVSTMPVRKPPWQIWPSEWQKAGTTSKRKRAMPRAESTVEQLAVQRPGRLRRGGR